MVQTIGANTWCKYLVQTQLHIHTHNYTYIHTSTHTCTRVYALAHTGFAELEYGMLRFMNSIDEKTLVVTTVHDCQVGVVASHNMRGLVLR